MYEDVRFWRLKMIPTQEGLILNTCPKPEYTHNGLLGVPHKTKKYVRLVKPIYSKKILPETMFQKRYTVNIYDYKMQMHDISDQLLHSYYDGA